MITPEDAEQLLKRMVDAALVTLDSIDSPVQLTDHEYEAVRDALPPKIADVIRDEIGVSIA